MYFHISQHRNIWAAGSENYFPRSYKYLLSRLFQFQTNLATQFLNISHHSLVIINPKIIQGKITFRPPRLQTVELCVDICPGLQCLYQRSLRTSAFFDSVARLRVWLFIFDTHQIYQGDDRKYFYVLIFSWTDKPILFHFNDIRLERMLGNREE